MNKQITKLLVTVSGIEMVLQYEGKKCFAVNSVEPVESEEFVEKVKLAKRYLFNEGFAYLN